MTRRMSRLLAAVVSMAALVAAGCPAAPDGTEDGGCEGCTEDCAVGFLPRTDGPGCQPIHASDCTAGTRPQLGTEACVPTGWTDCGAHFEADPSGWGCRPRLPSGDCGPWGLAVPGETACVPLDDCDAPFPPTGATHFVDPGFTDAELDATHVRTISEALVAAGPGSVIAIERGDYAESLRPTAAVTLAGRCAAETRVLGDGFRAGLRANGVDVELQRLTLSGHLVGVIAEGGAAVGLSQTALVANDDLGVLAEDAGTTVGLDRSLVRDTIRASGGVFGYGVLAQSGARVEATRSAFLDNAGGGLVHLEPGTTGSLSRCAVSGGSRGAEDVRGVSAERGGSVTVEDSALTDLPGHALFTGVSGSSISLSRVRVDAGGVSGDASALWVQDGATANASEVTFTQVGPNPVVAIGQAAELVLERSTVTEVPGVGEKFGMGLNILRGARATLANVAVTRVEGVGVLVHDAGTSASFSGVLVSDGQRYFGGDPSSGFGWGVWVDEGAELQADDLVVLDARGFGAGATQAGAVLRLSRSLLHVSNSGHLDEWATALLGVPPATIEVGASSLVAGSAGTVLVEGPDTRVSIWDSVLEETHPTSDEDPGHGAVFLGGSEVVLRRVTLRGHRRIGLAFEASAATVDACVIAANGIGIQAQGGTTLVEEDASGEPTPGMVRVSPDTVFVDNGVRVGSGAAALPSPSSVVSDL